MANTRSAAKRARQTFQRTLRNQSVTKGLKHQQKRLVVAVRAGDSAKAQTELDVLTSRLDKAAKRGIVHQNLANRRKSRAGKLVAAIATRQKSGGTSHPETAEQQNGS